MGKAVQTAGGLSRRSMMAGFVGAGVAGAGVVGAGVVGAVAPSTMPSTMPVAALDPDLRDAALRGFALAEHRGDPVTAAAARASLARMAEADPEAALLARLYKLLDVRPAAYWHPDGKPQPQAAPEALALAHQAIRACQPLHFTYTDRGGNETERLVLPLALVHPPQGVKLLAWCDTGQGFRQFFVRAMAGVAVQAGSFAEDRLALLEGLVEKEDGGL